MKIYLMNENNIIKYKLPIKIEEDYLINIKNSAGTVDNVLTIAACNDKWNLKSNGNVNVTDGQKTLDDIELKEYCFNYLKIIGQNNYMLLMCVPSQEKNIKAYKYSNLNSIALGTSNECNIRYNHPLFSQLQAIISFKDNKWYIQTTDNSKLFVYINDKRIITSELEYGDIIFIGGLRIVWMKDFILMNNPNNLLTVNALIETKLKTNNNINIESVSDEDSSQALYHNEQYFYHIPRLKTAVREEEIEIDAPPVKQEKEDIPFILSIGSSITMFGSSFAMTFNIFNNLSQGRGMMSVLPQIIMVVALFIGGIIMPRILQSYKNKMAAKKEVKRQQKYKMYLKGKQDKMYQIMKEQTAILYENNPSITECYDKIMNSSVNSWSRNLWNREIVDDDFLTVRLGLGNYESKIIIKAPEEHFSLEDDNLLDMVYKVASTSKILKDVPITFSFLDNTISSIVFNCSYRFDYIKSLMVQILANHSGNDLKIVIFTNKSNENSWNFMKNLPHCWSSDKKVRFFATNTEEYTDIGTYLDEDLKNRYRKDDTDDNIKNTYNEEKLYKNFNPYYLIITDDYPSIKNLQFINDVLEQKNNSGFSFVTLSNTMKNLPNRCEWFLQISDETSCILKKELNSQNQVMFKNEVVRDININNVAVTLSNIPLKSADEATSFPTTLPFLEMLNVSKIEQLNILNKWQVDNPVASLSTTIGIHSNGEPFKLDLHEKYHGPHGLIAGSTGSGKSEFIITYILSLAINYHPYEVQFVLIDYKGGGLAGAFENKETGVRLPHLIGTITNLDTSEMNRTLVSLESELKRRQKKFNQVRDSLGEGTIDIYKYQRLYREGTVAEPMSHLFIISDEFAELKSQQPEFMNQLISISRIGRSLGVHLILATQKPSGVVNDQIWSNSKFKVCLKVQTKEDSNEMLKRPDAASIRDVGRFYLQVGYNDYFEQGQSGWAGAKYVPSNKILKKIDDSINFINNVGFDIKTINDVVRKDANVEMGDQLTNIVKYISNLSVKENIVTNKLWLDKIADIIYIDDLKKKYNYNPKSFYINPVIGEYDEPAYQNQGLLNLDLTNKGNVLIYGKTGSGKDNLVTTIVWSSIVEHTPEEVNIYIIDCGAETLQIFNHIPHVGKVANSDDDQGIKDIIKFIEDEIEYRKNLFTNYGGNYLNYIQSNNNKLPLMLFIINGFDNFAELYQDEIDRLVSVFRDSIKYGIISIITAISSSSVRLKLAQSFENIIVLQLTDESEYRMIINSERGMFPANIFGRGLTKVNNEVLEFQSAKLCNDNQLNDLVKNATIQLNNVYKVKAKIVPSVPDIVTIDTVINELTSIASVPIGYDIKTKEIAKYDFTKNCYNIITTTDVEIEMHFIYALVEELSNLLNIEVIVLDFVKKFDKKIDKVKIYKENLDEIYTGLSSALNSDSSLAVKYVYILVGLRTKNSLYDKFSKLFETNQDLLNNIFILFDNNSSLGELKFDNWFKSINKSFGIWLGTGIENQNILGVDMLNYEDRKISVSDIGYVVINSKYKIIKHITDEGESDAE